MADTKLSTQKGLATAIQITKLGTIEESANINSAGAEVAKVNGV